MIPTFRRQGRWISVIYNFKANLVCIVEFQAKQDYTVRPCVIEFLLFVLLALECRILGVYY